MPIVWTQSDLDTAKAALLTAISTGKTVRFADREWTSHDLPELQALIAAMERSVSGGSGSRLAAFHKGV